MQIASFPPDYNLMPAEHPPSHPISGHGDFAWIFASLENVRPKMPSGVRNLIDIPSLASAGTSRQNIVVPDYKINPTREHLVYNILEAHLSGDHFPLKSFYIITFS